MALPSLVASFEDFLGTWVLDPRSCQFDQGEAPTAGFCRIEELGEQLMFTLGWTNADGSSDQASFSGRPDGVPRPFSGGPIADSMSITAVSDRELNSVAFFRGKRQMIAQRQLDETRQAMRLTQVVHFEDGTRLANVSVYRKRVLN